MIVSFRPRPLPLLKPFAQCRTFSTPVDIVRPQPTPQKAGALRPHLNIPVKPDHGLWAFFRKTEVDGEIKHQTVEASEALSKGNGRPWEAAELRRKSFRDLHTLWYVLLRERNLLASQAEELRRLGGSPMTIQELVGKPGQKCRKSMARIKYVVNERRLAYEGAVKIFAEKKEAQKVAEQLVKKASRRVLVRERKKKAMEAQKQPSEAATLAIEGLLR
ncbi:hypothetical protein EW146_g4099 [Bondarzewia mesenterica]|uniref:Large ribosomal subunit protein uL29m n=1 Tax=Bondarzewia mesenterica TaxID=1095465 RepID=A0A4S4LXQ4_9AGAM|nr:hypothetical protein EW146_g4099 [Bondarzewia mesenterica]